MEKMINKRRAGDENIGKLIVFAITIVIAIGLVGLVSYFYSQSRQVTVNTSVLGDVNSTLEDIKKIPELNGCSSGTISYEPIANTYSLTGSAGSNCDVSGIKGIKGTNASYQIAK